MTWDLESGISFNQVHGPRRCLIPMRIPAAPGSLQFTQAVVQNFDALQMTVTALKQPFRD
jgi:hypothetical protein